MDNKEKKVLEEAGLLYPAPNCIEYCQMVKATADEIAQRIFEAMSDTVTVVRCKDCRFCGYDEMFDEMWCNGKRVSADWFCADGERREDGKTEERDE